MMFWLIAAACYLLTLWLVARYLPGPFRVKFRRTTMCLELALAVLLITLTTGWRTWDLTSWSTGRTTYSANVMGPSILLFLFWIIMAWIFYFKERRH